MKGSVQWSTIVMSWILKPEPLVWIRLGMHRLIWTFTVYSTMTFSNLVAQPFPYINSPETGLHAPAPSLIMVLCVHNKEAMHDVYTDSKYPTYTVQTDLYLCCCIGKQNNHYRDKLFPLRVAPCIEANITKWVISLVSISFKLCFLEE